VDRPGAELLPCPDPGWSHRGRRSETLFSYFVRRALYVIPLILGVSLLVFVLFNMVGGDPTLMMLGKHANKQSIADLRHELGFDRPKVEQFFFQLKQQLTFDFGRSFSTKQKISSMLAAGVMPSLCLTVPPFCFGLCLAITIALLVCYFRGSVLDRSVVVATVAGMSITPLAYILAGQYLLAYRMDLFPITGWEYPDNFLDPNQLWNMVAYLWLPWIIWVVTGLGADVRFFRTVILDEISQDYVRTARSKGLSEPVVFFKHILKNAMIPIITSVVILIPYLYTGSLLLENFFGIPGLGSLAINAINTSDFPVIKAVTFIGALLYIVFNLISDICYALVDPRVKLG
jgi:peptide/nickel transport system permease protein